MRSLWHGTRSERGSTIVIMSVMLFSMLAGGAGDRPGLPFGAREVRAASGGRCCPGRRRSLRDFPSTEGPTVDSAYTWALILLSEHGARRYHRCPEPDSTWSTYGWGRVLNVEAPQVTLNIIPDSQKVRAWVWHAGVQTFFGGLLGKPYGHVQAMATAWASNDGPTVDCLKPFVLPDMWWESDKTTQDVDGDDYMDPITTNPGPTQDGESWKYEPTSSGDYYEPFDPSVANPSRPQTGYGSPMRSAQGYAGDRRPCCCSSLKPGRQHEPGRRTDGQRLLGPGLRPGAEHQGRIQSGCAEAAIGDSVPYDNGGRTDRFGRA